MYPIVLDEQQRKRLSDAFKTSDDPRLRLCSQAVLLASRSHPTEQIAQDLGVSVRTVRRWLCAFVQRGLAQMVPPWGPGRPAKIPESEADRIKQWVVDGPLACGRLRANSTYAELAEHIHKELGIPVSRRAVCNFCYKHGIRPYRPTYRYLRGDPAKQQAAKEQLAALKKRLPSRRVSCGARMRPASRLRPRWCRP